MIIEPDFPDHWKTQLLIKLTQDPAAPLLIIRLWAFCQQRRAWCFADLSNEALAAVCRWNGEPEKLRHNLIESGYVDEIEEDGKPCLVVHDFDEVNSKLVANWHNGPKGGRPKKTQPKPTANPPVTGMGDKIDKKDSGDLGENIPPTPASGGNRKKGSKRDKLRTAVLPGTQPEPKRGRMLALNAIVRRPPTDPWSAAEQSALEASGLIEADELDFVDACETVRAYYHANIPREIQARFWKRTTLDKLLENWGGELDKARAWARERDDGVRKVS